MLRHCCCVALTLVLGIVPLRVQAQRLRFERVKISDTKFEAASACDVNRDGKMDIVSGGFWYEGPEFTTQHKIWDVPAQREYHDDFHDYPMDVNGDGWVDIVTGGWFSRALRWLENPKGEGGEWEMHPIAETGPIETTRFWDVDGDGYVEACPNAGGNVVFFRLERDAEGKGKGRFTRHEVKMGGCGHGLGYGDVNGDGRGDFVAPGGWIEAPEDPLAGEWQWHPELKLGGASVPILVRDVNGDGRSDLIVGQGHNYGLDWWEQGVDGEGKRTWTKHAI
ncbi:MAG: FG-GAP repeat domain-containing protein, partial [Armatimonadota bacterium]